MRCHKLASEGESGADVGAEVWPCYPRRLGFATGVGRWLLHRSRRRRSGCLHVRPEARPVGLAVYDQVEGVILEAVDGALGE